MSVPLRVIIDPPAPGAWNMAVDEALLHSTEHEGLTLRFYQWSEPTLSLGYFQALAERNEHVASRHCAIVRRASGGGAILHDDELTYSIVAPVSQRWGAATHELYTIAHEALCAVLAEQSVQATMFELPSPALFKATEPFLCFQRRSPGDVVLAGAKICGSAQRRHLNRVLQHGSLLLGRSNAAPELAGLRELTGLDFQATAIRERWLVRLAQRLHSSVCLSPLTEQELTVANEFREGKFSSPKWLDKR